MDCTEEELTKTNVFQLDILIPLIEIFDVYNVLKSQLSPDEFCIYVFIKEEEDEFEEANRCKKKFNPVRPYFENLERFQALPSSLQSIIVDLLMNMARYATFLESIGKDYLDKQNCRNYEQLHQIMVFVYILSYRIFYLFFEDSIDCFAHFKAKKMLSLVTYLLRTETPNLYHEKGCLIYEEDFVDHNLVLPFLDATQCLEELRGHLKKYMKSLAPPKKELTMPVYMNVLHRPRQITKTPPNTPVVSNSFVYFTAE